MISKLEHRPADEGQREHEQHEDPADRREQPPRVTRELRELRGGQPPPFRYRDFGNMAVIGRAAAVAELGKLRLRGYLAWLIWLFIHLINLVEFKNRVLVLFQWGWSYITRNRSARLITNDVTDDEMARVSKGNYETTQL